MPGLLTPKHRNKRLSFIFCWLGFALCASFMLISAIIWAIGIWTSDPTLSKQLGNTGALFLLPAFMSLVCGVVGAIAHYDTN